MLGRRQYRIKVLQGLYAFFQGGEQRIEIAEKNLLHSIDKTTELYFLQLSFLLEVIGFYQQRMEDAKHKFLPTPEELAPNPKLSENLVVIQLLNNQELMRKFDQYKFNWGDDQEMVRKVYQKIRNSKDHLEYLSSPEKSFKEDLEFISKIFRKYIAKSPELQFYCEERSIYWSDDFDWAASFVLKSLKLITPDFTEASSLISLLVRDADENPDEERKFIQDLFRKTIIHSEEFEKMIDERTRNWELDRIALTDIILIKMALTELLHFSNIPVKVTMNEYIEISKYFSSVKSKLFINGILDKMVADLKAENKIKKVGRGLIN